MALIKKIGVRREEMPEEVSAEQVPAAPPTRRIRDETPATESPAAPITREIAEKKPEPAEERPRPPTLIPGDLLQERYQIETILGIGGMSVVYKGRDLRFKTVYRPCAIKEMIDRGSPEGQTRSITLKNFEREASLLATLNHPAIPKIYDYFTERGRIYLVLEFIEGKTLEDLLDESEEPFSEEEVVHWAIDICDVLSYLHNHKPEAIVFRDMKPANVMLTPEGKLVLIDFGIARIFEEERKGTMIGTEGYSPPEQYRGVAEPRGDLYALGATMHHLLTRSDPRLETPFTFHERPLSRLNPKVSPQLEAVVMKSLEYDINRRWSSAAEMRAALIDLAHIDLEDASRKGVAAGPTAEKGRLLWAFQCEEEVRATPTVYGGIVYVGVYDNNLYAIDASSGKFLWKFPTQGGICATACPWERVVLVASEDGTLYAVDAQRGRPLWNVRTGGPIRSSPRVFHNHIYVGSDDQSVYAFSPRGGEQLWSYRTWGPVRSSAVLAENRICIGSGDGHVYALDAVQGELQWKYRTNNPVVSSGAVHDNLLIVGSWDGYIYALDHRSGWPAWKTRTERRVTSSPAIYANRVYVGSADGKLYCLDLTNGRQLWDFDTGSFITSSPYVVEGKVYFGAGNGRVYCLQAESGKELWSFPTGGPITSSAVVVEGVLYIGSTDQKVYALQV